MKKNWFFPVFIFHFFLSAQDLPSLEELNNIINKSEKSLELINHIKSENDFNQSDFGVDEIETQIELIINSQEERSLYNVQVPINSKKIKYLGYMHPANTNLFNSDYKYFLENDKSIKGDSTHIFKYDNFYISTKGNRLIDNYLVYYSIRAYIILKYRFPNIYETLFENTAEVPLKMIGDKNNVQFVNLTKNYFITFDGQNPLPENNAYFGKPFSNPKYPFQIYPNTQVIYLNKTTLKNGGTAPGGLALYPSGKSPSDRFHLYMRDGLIHTIVHEKIHDWIFQYKNINELAKFLREDSKNLGFVKNYYPLEEAFVNNTTNILFELKNNSGGLSQDILKYYRKDFEISISKFKKEKNYEKLLVKLQKFVDMNNQNYNSISFKNSIENRIYFIDFNNPLNLPLEKL